MALPKVVNYLKNVGTSVVYASVEVIKEDMETVKTISANESNKEIAKNLYTSIRDYKQTARRIKTAVTSSKLYDAATFGINAAFEDIKSGKFYNTEREKQLEDAIAEKMADFGDDDIDFGNLDSDIDIDMNFDDEDPEELITKGDKLIAASTEVSSMKNAKLVAGSVVKTGQAQIEATKASTMFMYSNFAKLNGELRADINNIGNKMISSAEKSNKLLENIATNSQKFFESTTKMLSEQTAALKEMAEMQRNMYGERQQKEEKKKIGIEDVLTGDGGIDLVSWGKSISKNFKSILSEQTGGALDMMGGFDDDSGNIFKTFVANPFGELTKAVIKATSPKQLRKSLKDFDKTLAGVAGTAIARFNNMANDEDSPLIYRMLGSLFGVKSQLKRNIDPGRFEKGPVPFDGITRATINNAITGYLARIEAAITGQPVKLYNPQTGKWITGKDLQKDYDNTLKSGIRSGTGDVGYELTKLILRNDKYRAASKQDKKTIEDNVESFLKTLYDRNGDFKFNKASEHYEWGVDTEDLFIMIATAMRQIDPSIRLGAAEQALIGRKRQTDNFKRMEETGHIFGQLFSNAFERKELHRKDTDPTVSGVAGNLAYFKDNKGKTLFYYLQNMYSELYAIHHGINNIGPIGSGGGGTGSEIDNFLPNNTPVYKTTQAPYFTFRDEHGELTAKHKKSQQDQAESIRYNEELQVFINEKNGKVYDISDGKAMKRILTNLSQEERVKLQKELMDSSNRFQQVMFNDALGELLEDEKKNGKGEKRNIYDKGKSFIEKFKAGNLEKKANLMLASVGRVTSNMSNFATDLVKKADARIYDFFYGAETGEETKEKKSIKGFMGLMKMKLNATLNDVADKFGEIFEPLKKKLGLDKWSDIYEKIGLKDIVDNIRGAILGEKDENGKYHGGILTNMRDSLLGALKDRGGALGGWLKDSIAAVVDPIAEKIQEKSNKPQEFQEVDVSEFVGGGVDGVTSDGKILSLNRDLVVAAKMTGKVKKGEHIDIKDSDKFVFNRHLIQQIIPITKAFKNHSFILRDMQYGKMRYLFDPAFLSNLKPENFYIKLYNPLVKYCNSIINTRFIEFMNDSELEAVKKYTRDERRNFFNSYHAAKRDMIKAIKSLEAWANRQPLLKNAPKENPPKIAKPILTPEEKAAMDKKDIEARDKQFRVTDFTENQKALQERLSKFKEDIKAGNLINNRSYRMAVRNNQSRRDSTIEEKKNTFSQNISKEDRKRALLCKKFARQCANVYSLDSKEQDQILGVCEEITYGQENPQEVLDSLNASRLVELCNQIGYNKLASKIDNIMLTKYNNKNYNIESLISANEKAHKAQRKTNQTSSQINPINNPVGTSATRLGDISADNVIFKDIKEILEKIYYKLDNTLPQIFERTRNIDLNTAIITDGFRPIQIGPRTNHRESETEAASQDDWEPPHDVDQKAYGGYIKKNTLSALSEGELYERDGLIGKVPKTGVYDIKAGTTIYPTKKNKAIELANEQSAIGKFIKSNARGDNADTKVIDGKVFTKSYKKNSQNPNVYDTVWTYYDKTTGKTYQLVEGQDTEEGKSLLESMADYVQSGFRQTRDRLTRNNGEDNKEKKYKSLNQVVTDIKDVAPDLGANAILGAGVGLLLGNPLLGAAVGATAGFASTSEEFKNWMFGEKVSEDSNERSGGIVSAESQKTLAKYLPSMGKFATAGAIAGLVTPFGLVGGALLGATAGYIKQNEEARIALFGTDNDENSGVITKKMRDRIKKAVPGMAVGAIASLALPGGFGLVGNMLLGSGLGFLSTTDEFKNAMLGEEVEIDGQKTRVGGLLGILSTEVVDPLAEWTKDFIYDTTDFLKKWVLQPLADNVPALIHEGMYHVGKAAGVLPKMIGAALSEYIGRPFMSIFGDLIAPVRNTLSTVAGLGGKLAKGAIMAPATLLKAAGNTAKAAQIRRGDAGYLMSAADRNTFRERHESLLAGDRFAQSDTTMAQMSEKQIDAAIATTESLVNSKTFYKKSLSEKLKTINRLVDIYFYKKDARRIYKALKNNQFDTAAELVSNCVPQNPEAFTKEAKRGLIEKINSCIKDVEGINRKRALTDEARAEALNKLKDAGFDGITDDDLPNLLKSLRHEKAVANLDTSRKLLPPEVTAQVDAEGDMIEKKLKPITSVLDEIKTALDTIVNKPVPESEQSSNIDATQAENHAKWEAEDQQELEDKQQKAKDEAQRQLDAQHANSNEEPGEASDESEAIPENIEDTQQETGEPKKKKKLKGIAKFLYKKLDEIDRRASSDERENRDSKIREFYDSDSNSVRRFKWTATGFKEISGKARSDADASEEEKSDSRISKLAKALKGKLFDDKDKEEPEKKKGGLLSKILKTVGGTLLGGLGKVFLGVTGVAAAGHAYDFTKDTLVPRLKTWWEESAQPWLQEHVGDKITAIINWGVELPGKIYDKLTGMWTWLGDNKDKVLDWYTDGIVAFGGMVGSAAKFLISNLWPIAKGLLKGMVPALEGIFAGVKSLFSKEEDLSYPASAGNISLDNNIVSDGNTALKNLGSNVKIDEIPGFNLDLNLDSKTSPEQQKKYNELQNYVKENNNQVTPEIYNQFKENAYSGDVLTDTGKVIPKYENSLMPKDASGNTLILNEDGEVVNSYDNAEHKDDSMLLRIGKRILRNKLTGSHDLSGGLLKVVGGAANLVSKGTGFLGKLKGTPAIVKYPSKIVSKITGMSGKVLNTTGDILNNKLTLTGTAKSIGEKVVGTATKVKDKAIKAKDTAVSLGSKLKNVFKKKGADAAADVAENAVESAVENTVENAANGGTTKLVTKIADAFFKLLKKILTYPKVDKCVQTVCKMLGHTEVTGEIVADLIEKVAKEFTQFVKDTVGNALAKMAGGKAKAEELLAKVTKFANYAAMVVDFLSGWDNAESILGIVEEATDYHITILERFMCGLFKLVNQKFLLGIVPEKTIINFLVDKIIPIFSKNANEALKKARAESAEYIKEINTRDGTNYDIESYNRKDKWYTKAKTALKNFGSDTINFLTGKNKQIEQETTAASNYGSGSNSTSKNILDNSATKFGTGRAYQKDPRFSGIRFNKSGDKTYQTIGDSGCGPAAAVNAVNYAYGTGNDLLSAANMAVGYKETDGGTRPEFFDRYFKENGLESNRVSNSEIESNLKRGNPVIMMGKDAKGGYNTPYGPNPHYITAKGLDRNGNIIIDDPENPNATSIYNKHKVIGNTSLAISANRYGSGKYGRGVDIEATKKVIWSFLRNCGYSEIATAGIMGNIQQECSFNYAETEKTSSSNPGIGLCQWTYKPRKKAFLAAVPDWETNLPGQLNFLWSEINSSYQKVLPAGMNACGSIEAAVRLFHDVYEKSADKTMDNRNKYARAIYQQFTGITPMTTTEINSTNLSNGGVLGASQINSDLNNINSDMGGLSEALTGLFKSALSAEYGHTNLGAIFGSGSGNRSKYGRSKSMPVSYFDDMTAHTTGNSNPSQILAMNVNTIDTAETKARKERIAKSINNPLGYMTTLDSNDIVKQTFERQVKADYFKEYIQYNNMRISALMEANSNLATKLQVIYKLKFGKDLDTSKYVVTCISECKGTSSNYDKYFPYWDCVYGLVKTYYSGLAASLASDYKKSCNADLDPDTAGTVGVILTNISSQDPTINGNTITDENGTIIDSSYENGLYNSGSSNSSFGSIIDVFKSAFLGAFTYTDKETGEKKNLLESIGLVSGVTGNSSNTTSSGLTFSSVSTNNSPAPAGLSSAQSKVYQSMSSILGKNQYSNSLRDHVGDTLSGKETGYGDCSSTVRWALMNGAGVDPGGDTGAQIDSSKGNWIDGPYSFGQNAKPNATNLAVGDLMFYGKAGSSKSRKVGHVEMYFGNNQRVGHGSGVGPKVSDYTAIASNQQYLGSKRFIPVGAATDVVSDTTESGLGSANIAKSYISSTFEDPTRESHNGVDIAAPHGEPIISNVSGEVVRSEYNDTNGNVVVIKDSNGNLHTFQHLLKAGPTVGSRVRVGSVLGYVGSTGESFGDHVHVSVSRPDGQYINPITNKPNASKRAIGGGSGVDYTSMIKSIIEVLLTIADNSNKMDTIIELLKSASINGGGLTAEQTASIASNAAAKSSQMRDSVNNLLGTNGNKGLASHDLSSIITAMKNLATD